MRNYKREYELKKQKFDEIRGNIDKELGAELREQLKKDNKTIASWITESAKKYLNKN